MPDLFRLADQKRDAARALSWPGLPAVRGVAAARRNPLIGSTRTPFTPQQTAQVVGLPSITLERLAGGGVATVIRFRATYPQLLDEGDLAGLNAWAGQVVERAKAQSKGNLSYADLKARNHPYGRGSRGGQRRGRIGRVGAAVQGVRGSVSDLSVVNRHRGDFAGAWKSEVKLTDSGAEVRIENESEVAGFLAFGTLRMKAHGPFTDAPTRLRSVGLAAWQRAVRQANNRKAHEADLAASLGIL